MTGKSLIALCTGLLLAVTSIAQAAGQVTEAHSGTRKGTVYEATPAPYGAPASPAATTPAHAAEPISSAGASGSAPVEPGAGVEIISGGGGGSEGAAKVGHLPVLK